MPTIRGPDYLLYELEARDGLVSTHAVTEPSALEQSSFVLEGLYARRHLDHHVDTRSEEPDALCVTHAHDHAPRK